MGGHWGDGVGGVADDDHLVAGPGGEVGDVARLGDGEGRGAFADEVGGWGVVVGEGAGDQGGVAGGDEFDGLSFGGRDAGEPPVQLVGVAGGPRNARLP